MQTTRTPLFQPKKISSSFHWLTAHTSTFKVHLHTFDAVILVKKVPVKEDDYSKNNTCQWHLTDADSQANQNLPFARDMQPGTWNVSTYPCSFAKICCFFFLNFKNRLCFVNFKMSRDRLAIWSQTKILFSGKTESFKKERSSNAAIHISTWTAPCRHKKPMQGFANFLNVPTEHHFFKTPPDLKHEHATSQVCVRKLPQVHWRLHVFPFADVPGVHHTFLHGLVTVRHHLPVVRLWWPVWHSSLGRHFTSPVRQIINVLQSHCLRGHQSAVPQSLLCSLQVQQGDSQQQ